MLMCIVYALLNDYDAGAIVHIAVGYDEDYVMVILNVNTTKRASPRLC